MNGTKSSEMTDTRNLDSKTLFEILHGWAIRKSKDDLPQEAVALARQLGEGSRCIAVSACLLGVSCRYDGAAKVMPALLSWVRWSDAVTLPLCPEVLALLGVPRPSMTFVDGDGQALNRLEADLINTEGKSCAEALRRGARRADLLAKQAGCSWAVLKERSPSCGLRQVHSDNGLIRGCGTFTDLLLKRGVRCFTEEEMDRVAKIF